MFSTKRKDIFVLTVLSLFALLSLIWIREIDSSEARNLISAREILQNSNWWTPTLNGHFYFENPPLPVWITAFVMMITRSHSEAILRLPNMLCCIFTVLFLYRSMIKIKKDRLFAFLCSFVLLTTFMFIKLGAENTWDIYTYSFAFCASLAFYVYIKYGERKNLYRMGILLILSFLSKGPVGFYSLFVPFLLAHYIIFPREIFRKKIIFVFFTIIVAVGISSIWGISMYLNHGNYFLDVVKNEVLAWTTKHSRSFIFYTDFVVYMGSWLFFSIFVLFRIPKERENKIFYLWTIIVLIFISLIEMKKKKYGLPLYLTSSITIGQLCIYYFRKPYLELKKREKTLLIVQQCFLVFVVLGSLAFLTYFGYIKKEITFGLFFLYAILHLLFLFLFAVGYTEINYAKRVIIFSGLTMLLVNFSSSWILESKFMQNNLLRFRIPVSQEVRESSAPIYSQSFDIEDVWRLGREIKMLNRNIPDERLIFYLGKDEPKDLLKTYEIKKVYDYQKVTHKMEKLYLLEKIY
ncbi:glycosyltransferase family 39 protein [Fusobacterium simiae]|uniref:ArnT family glycosyltransferase n=1 Tax=Fusobacterium TaxID=848 RepID=UPI0003F907B8|nr:MULTISPECIES: glycosyltransferase family 39 protein [Fusobacterium]MDC7954854.1 glycosyltransferase family 39 protein [Fusobacterium simiae]